MTEHSIRLYLDEDVDVLLAELLRPHGFDALTTHAAGRTRKSDPEQLAFAVAAGRTMVTHNRSDFEALDAEYRLQGRRHRGILLAFRRPPRDIASRLVVLLTPLRPEGLKGLLLYL